MTSDQLKKVVGEGLDVGLGVLELRTCFEQFAQAGGSQEDAMKVLKQIRAEAQSESVEDRVLELMDVVEGFIRREFRIW